MYLANPENCKGIKVDGHPTQEEWDYLYPLCIVFAVSGGKEPTFQAIKEAADVLAWSFNNYPTASTFN